MLSCSRFAVKLALAALIIPLAGFSAAIQANGTCEVGNCASPDSVGIGQVSAGSFNFNITVGTDLYNVKGVYANAYPPQILGFFPTVTYIGATPSTAADSISLIMFQNFYDVETSPWDGKYCESFPAVVAAGGSATDTTSFDGNSVATLTAGPGTSTQSACKNIAFTTAQNASDYMDAQIALTFNFAKGTSPNALIASPSPEPAQTIPAVIGLASLLFLKLRKSRSGKIN